MSERLSSSSEFSAVLVVFGAPRLRFIFGEFLELEVTFAEVVVCADSEADNDCVCWGGL